jgi:four helix bundle protein
MEKMEPIFDLHKRTLRFATQIVKYVRTFPRDVAGFEIGGQLIRSGTSPGANYEEADACAGPKEFIYKIRTCLKESQESRYWLTLSKSAFGESELNTWLLNEVDELIRIFNSIIVKTIKKRKSQDQSSNQSQA